MFKKQLATDIKKIWGLKKVIFGTVEEGLEQDVAYVDVEEVKQQITQGFIKFRVKIKLGIIGTKEANRHGFLLSRLKQASKKPGLIEDVNRFLAFNREEDIKFEDYEGFFTQTSQRFLYCLTIEYDPAAKTKGFIAKVIEKIRGSK